jgi:cytochrome c553
MIKKLLLLSLLVSSLSVFAAAEEIAEAKPMKKGDAEKGSKLVGTCVACHGADGNSVVGQWPTLAGQRESYLFEQLEHIRDEERVIAVMKGLLNNYSDDDLRDVSAFYASQKTKVSQADEANLALGQQIYRAGNLKSGVPACTGCHGPAGKGLESAQYPMLGGQKAEYVVTSLIAYQTGERAIDEHGKIMQGIATRLTIEEIRAVANYVSGLY